MDKLDIELRKHLFISFVEDHYNPLNIIRSLGEKGINSIVILVGESVGMISHCKYIKKLHYVKTQEEGYSILLKNYSEEQFKPYIFCSDDKNISFLDKHYNELKEKFIVFNAGTQGRIAWLQNKNNITDLAEQVGLIIPRKEIVDTGNLPIKLNYPIITKVLSSTMGAWKNDVYICNNEKELASAYKKIKSPKLILQEYIKKKGEFCMEGFSINGGQNICIPYVADYIRFYNNSYGHYMDIVPFLDADLKLKIEELLKLTKYNGIFEIEFMKGPNFENYFLEVNFRASTWNYALTIGGCNLPYFWAKSYLAGRILYEEMSLRTTSFKAIVEPADFIRNAKNIGVFRWLMQCFKAECHYYFNKKDPWPFLYYILNKISKRKIEQ